MNRKRLPHPRGTQETEGEDLSRSSHFALDREVELRLLNPSTATTSASNSAWKVVHPQGQVESKSPPNTFNKLVSKKKVVPPFSSVRRRELKMNKKRIHIPGSPPRRSPTKNKPLEEMNKVSPLINTSLKVSKPWRANMKLESKEVSESLLPEESCPSRTLRKKRSDFEELKEYMRNKSTRHREESLKAKKISFMRKEAIKNRLEDLELRRKEKAVVSSSSPTKNNFCPIHGYNNGATEEVEPQVRAKVAMDNWALNSKKVTSSTPKRSAQETLKDVQRNKLDNILFLKLEELTNELGQKKSSQKSIEQKKKINHAESVGLSLSTTSVSISSPASPHKPKNELIDNRHKKHTIDRTTSPIQSLISKHEKDISFVKEMDSNLLPASLKKSNNFNFLSTVKRKMANEEPGQILSFATGGVPFQEESKKTEDTLSEGPMSTSLASLSKKSSNTSSAKSISKVSKFPTDNHSLAKANIKAHSSYKLDSDTPSNKSIAQSSKSNTISEPKGDQADFVPNALHLRFLAELDQLENVQSTEKHIDKLDRIKDISTVRHEATTMAHLIKGLRESSTKHQTKHEKSSSKKESRAEFENRIRKEFNDLFQGSIQPLIESQTEATRATADATKMLASLHKNFLDNELKNKNMILSDNPEEVVSESFKSAPPKEETQANPDLVSSEASRPSVNTIPEEVISLISKTESSIPEVLSVLEKASRSGDSIRQTISEVMSRKNEEDPLSSCSSVTLNTINITEEIENEISPEDPPPSSTPTRAEESRYEGFPMTSSGDISSEFTLNMIEHHIQVESSRASNQYLRLKLKEKKIVEKAKSEMSLLETEKKALRSANQDSSHISKKQKMIVMTVQSQRKEIKALKEKLKAAERERQAVLKRQRTLLRDRWKRPIEVIDQNSDITSQSDSVNIFSDDLTISKNFNFPTYSSSPKVSRRELDVLGEDSLTNISQSSDHSDAAIRVNVLKDELQKQKSMAKRLREQQKIKKQENLRAQTEALKKQIETYDRLILRTREEINNQEASFEVVPPQIKTPGSKSRSLSESDAMRTLSDDVFEQDATSNKTSTSETIATEIPSQGSPPSSPLSSASYTSSKASTVIPETVTTPHKEKEGAQEKDVENVSSDLFNSLMTDTVREYSSLKDLPESKTLPTKNDFLESKQQPSPTKKSHIPRPQDFMLTTFDLDDEPGDSVVPTPNVPSTTVHVLDDDENDVGHESNSENVFIDDDFGLGVIKKESEELRHKEMLIAEEINRVHEEASGLQKAPPPPYAVETSSLRRIPAIFEVPSHLISTAENLRVLVPEMLACIQNNPSHADEGMIWTKLLQEPSRYEEPDEFLDAIYDTLGELRSALPLEHSEQNPPWMKQKALPRLRGLQVEDEAGLLLRETLCIFGREKKSSKEALVLRSFKKKRSYVDNLLAQELISEKDGEWGNYDAEEVVIKDSLTSSILHHILKDTVNEIKHSL